MYFVHVAMKDLCVILLKVGMTEEDWDERLIIIKLLSIAKEKGTVIQGGCLRGAGVRIRGGTLIKDGRLI